MIPADHFHDNGDGTAVFVTEWTMLHRRLSSALLDLQDAFTVEVEGEWSPRMRADRTLTVHVIDVLPIRKHGENYPVDHEHVEHWHNDKWFHWFKNDRWRPGDPSSSEWVWDAITLPPAAEPGMWLVRLAVHT